MPTSEAGLSPGAIAGIVVAAVVAALLIGLIVGFIIFWIYRYQKWPVNTKTEGYRRPRVLGSVNGTHWTIANRFLRWIADHFFVFGSSVFMYV